MSNPRDAQLSIRLPADLLAKLERFAAADDRSVASVVRVAIVRHLQQIGAE